VGGATGRGIRAVGGATSGAGIKAYAQNNNDAGMELIKHGTGKDIDADEIDGIKTKTDSLAFTAGNVHSHTKATDVGGDASAANQTTIINHLTAIKDGDAGDYEPTTDSLHDLRAKVDTISGAAPVNVQHDSTVILR